MISYLRGMLAAKTANSIIIDVAGVGYTILLSARSIEKLPTCGEEVQIRTLMVVREDAIVLYGFTSEIEKTVFEKLTSVSSVGPKIALSALGTYAPDELIGAINRQDAASIQRIPGVGKKMASRIMLELKDSFADVGAGESAPVSTNQSQQVAAHEDLLAMGFTSQEAELALRGAPQQATETELLQYALKRLGE